MSGTTRTESYTARACSLATAGVAPTLPCFTRPDASQPGPGRTKFYAGLTRAPVDWRDRIEQASAGPATGVRPPQDRMQTQRWTTTASRLGCHAKAVPRARFSITVAPRDAETLRAALVGRLDGCIERLASVPVTASGTREAAIALHLVLHPDAVDEVLQVVMATATCAELGRVHRI